MRIGVVSDTHDNLTNVARIVELFDAAGVERVVHTGDITRAATLEILGRLQAPLVGVFGNNDKEREALETAARSSGIRLVDPPLRLTWHERTLTVAHDPLAIPAALLEESEILLHGHTHRRVIERSNGCLVFNPGECAGILEGRNAVGVLDLDSLAAELLHF
jgi:putative phosphoesterase